MNSKNKNQKEIRRQKRVRVKIKETTSRPRLCVFRSGRHIYAQIIDNQGKTLMVASDLKAKKVKKTKVEVAKEIGQSIAKQAQEKKIQEVVFDRGSYRYHGRVKAVAEGAREGGLKF
jgi:large subunit ribosomal protein L18